MVVQKRQTPAQTHAAQALGVHPAGIPAEAEEQKNHDRAAQPDVSRVNHSAAGRLFLDCAPSFWVVHSAPDERLVFHGGLLADDGDLQRHRDGEPD